MSDDRILKLESALLNAQKILVEAFEFTELECIETVLKEIEKVMEENIE